MTSRRDLPPVYPDAAGYRRPGPSQDAAEAIGTDAANLRSRVLTAFRAAPGGLTADEAAAVVQRSVLSVRPRVAELHRMGEVRQTGERRKNGSGMTATVWCVADPLPCDLPTVPSPTISASFGSRGQFSMNFGRDA